MAARINITCAACKKQMAVPEEYAGKKIRCKGCQEVITVPAAEAKPAAPKSESKPDPKKSEAIGFAADENEQEDGKAYSVVGMAEALPRCPHCANEMPSMTAIICIHCGYNTRSRTKKDTRVVWEQSAGEIFMWRLGAFVSLIVIILLLTLDGFVIAKRESWFDFLEMEPGKDAKQGEKNYLINPGALALYITMAVIFVSYKLLRYVIKRLVYESRPPERKVERAKS
jgi:hypothetical protein